MSLISLQVKNFKSIVDITFALNSPFAVFAGSNGSGKSNLFEALEFVRDIIRSGAVDAIKRHNGYENIRSHKLRDKNAKKFYCKMELAFGEDYFTYELEVKDLNKAPTTFETVIKNDIEIGRKSSQENIFIQGNKIELDYSMGETLLKLISKEAKPLLNFLTSIERYQIDPIRAREADDYFAEDVLDKYASNLTTVLSVLEKNGTVQEEIVDMMQMIVPGLEQISVEREKLNNKSVVVFKEDSTRRKFPAGLVSDGTIYALAMLVIIYSNKNGIVMIEEPERGLNPKAIAEVVELFREKSNALNVFINTHSESVVRVLKPQELFLVDKVDGKTKINNVHTSFPDYDYKELNIDQMWMSNLFDGGLPW